MNYKLFVTRFVLFAAGFAFVCFPSAAMANSKSKSNSRYASIVMDADTGFILHQSHADKKLHPASLTKVMTLLMVFDALEHGQLRLNDRVRISQHAADMIPSKLDLPVGSSIRVKDAIDALVTKSANDIAVALAEHIGGTEPAFAQMMTRKAHAIGMSRTTFRNASGLHDVRQVTTARDMAKMAQVVIQDYPQYYPYFSQKSFTYKGKSYQNHNRLMSSYKGMDGMKTGYIRQSGFNLVASAVRNNHRVIGVVFGGRTAQSRNDHMVKLLDRGFTDLNGIRIAEAKVPMPPRKPGILTAVETLNKIDTAAGVYDMQDGLQKWASINTSFEDKYSRLLGEGDYDPSSRRRIETGLMAIAAHRGEHYKNPRSFTPKSVEGSSNSLPAWSVQVGAFESRAATDRALSETLKKLPRKYAAANPVIAPLKTGESWLFRARLSGFTKDEAMAACRYISDCLPVAPQNYQGLALK